MQWKQYVLSEVSDKYYLVGFVASSLDEAIEHAKKIYHREFRFSQIREIGLGALPIVNCPSFIDAHTKLLTEGVLPYNPATSTNIFSVYYYAYSAAEYQEMKDPPGTSEIIAYVDGDVEKKLTQWAKESGYMLDSWEKPYPGVAYVELML